jgi:hypothetical protein
MQLAGAARPAPNPSAIARRPLRSWQQLRAARCPPARCSSATLSPGGGAELAEPAAGAGEAAARGEEHAAASSGGKIRRRKNESYEQYKARRDKRMQEEYKSLSPEEVERRMKIGQANSKRVPWNKGRKHSPGGWHGARGRAGRLG